MMIIENFWYFWSGTSKATSHTFHHLFSCLSTRYFIYVSICQTSVILKLINLKTPFHLPICRPSCCTIIRHAIKIIYLPFETLEKKNTLHLRALCYVKREQTVKSSQKETALSSLDNQHSVPKTKIQR